MLTLLAMQPFVRTANYYQFSAHGDSRDIDRVGYCYAFHLIERGKGTITVSGSRFNVKKGDLLYIPPGHPHAFYSDSTQPLASYNVYCELWVEAPMNTDHHISWKPEIFDPALLTPVRLGTELDQLAYFHSVLHHIALADSFAYIVKHFRSKENYSVMIVSSLLKAVILQVVQFNSQTRLLDYRIKPIIERIDKEAANGSHYDVWLKESGLRKTQFHELFRQATGMSPKAYWTKAIMQQAAVILRESNRTITDIAEELGYSSIHHFTKQFSAYYGTSPSDYRKNMPL